MKNWLTTLFGAVTAAGLFLSHSTNATVATIGNVVSVVGSLLLGGSSKDASNPS